MKFQCEEFNKILNYSFKNLNLVEEALTHPSLQGTNNKKFNYERLEFLGDSILCFIISEILYKSSDKNEGILAKKRAFLVCRNNLFNIASKLGLQHYILMSKGEEDSGGRKNEANLENVLEAVIGALYLDGGIEIVREFVAREWENYLKQELILSDDPKSSVQEWAQKNGRNLPKYLVISQIGYAHEPVFTIELQIEGEDPVRAIGNSKKNAERKAAEIFLCKHGIENKAV